MAYDPVARDNSRTALWIGIAVFVLLLIGTVLWYNTKDDVDTVVVNPAPSVVIEPTAVPQNVIIEAPAPAPVIVNPAPPVVNPPSNKTVIINRPDRDRVITRNKETVITKEKVVVATPTPALVEEPTPLP